MIVQLNLKRLQISHNLSESALALICEWPIVRYGCQLDPVPDKVLLTQNFKICLIHKLVKMLQFSSDCTCLRVKGREDQIM